MGGVRCRLPPTTPTTPNARARPVSVRGLNSPAGGGRRRAGVRARRHSHRPSGSSRAAITSRKTLGPGEGEVADGGAGRGRRARRRRGGSATGLRAPGPATTLYSRLVGVTAGLARRRRSAGWGGEIPLRTRRPGRSRSRSAGRRPALPPMSSPPLPPLVDRLANISAPDDGEGDLQRDVHEPQAQPGPQPHASASLFDGAISAAGCGCARGPSAPGPAPITRYMPIDACAAVSAKPRRMSRRSGPLGAAAAGGVATRPRTGRPCAEVPQWGS